MNTFDLSFKLSRSARFCDGHIGTLLDVDQAATEQLIADDYDALDPQDLVRLPPNSRITYVRRDTGKPVIGVVIVKHFVTKHGHARTTVAWPSPATIRLTPRQHQAGIVRFSSFGAQQWCIAVGDLEALFACKSIRDTDRLTGLERRLESMEAIATQAMTAIIGICDRLERLDSAQEKNNSELADLRLHSNEQLKILSKVAARLTIPAGARQIQASHDSGASADRPART
jgi:hypothetical protein